MAWAVLPNGTLPAMAVTLKGDMPSPVANAANAEVSQCAYLDYNRTYRGNSSSVDGTGDMILTGIVNIGEEDPPDPMPTINFFYFSANTYSVVLDGYAAVRESDNATVFTSEELANGGKFYINRPGIGGVILKYTFTLSKVDINYHANISVGLTLKKFDDDSTATTMTQTVYVDGVLPYYNAYRKGQAWIAGLTIGTGYADGVYYLDVTVDGTHYYTEPFMWLSNLGHYTAVTYRRSTPILTTENYIVFSTRAGVDRSLTMYLPNIKQRPPYQFDVDVTEIDGRKYAEKQISYRKDRIAFNCYEAFVEAVRLLWHCDIRYVGGVRIDYMEPPEVDWSNDNHLCDVVLEMESDTVVQTNGTASAYIDSSDANHQSYDASFDASFN